MSEVAQNEAQEVSAQPTATATKFVDSALKIAGRVSLERVEQLRRTRPHATRDELVRILDREFVTALTSQGVGAGAAAAVPGFGTVAALAITGGEAVLTTNLTAVYVLALAELHETELRDIERRRELLVAVLMGGSAKKAVGKVAQRTGKHWARKIVEKTPMKAIKGVNKVMGHNFVTKYGTKQGIVVLGKVVPFGVGAAIGGTMNFVMAQGIVRSAHRVFEIEGPVEMDPQDAVESMPLPGADADGRYSGDVDATGTAK